MVVRKRFLKWMLFCCLPVWAGPSEGMPYFQGLGDLPGGAVASRAFAVSGDGSTVVGASESASGLEAFRWTRAGGLVGLGDLPGGEFRSIGQGVSRDGSVIVGTGSTAAGNEAFRWTGAQGITSISGHSGDATFLFANAVSADGSVVVGGGTTGPFQGIQPVVWTATTGIYSLGLAPGTIVGSASAISADGSVVAGTASNSGQGAGTEGTRWTAGTGNVKLGDIATDAPPPGTRLAGISGDGTTLVGNSSGNGGVIWTEAAGFQLLNEPVPGSTFLHAASGDGAIVVGTSIFVDDLLAVELNATIWDSANGHRLLADVVTNEFGIALAGWELSRAESISEDGRTIVGRGFNASGIEEAWILVIPEPTSAVLLGFGFVGLAARRGAAGRSCQKRARRRCRMVFLFGLSAFRAHPSLAIPLGRSRRRYSAPAGP